MIWLNGTFGVGKTSTADELVRRMPGSRLYDPEEVGFLLHRLLPETADSDFQDIPCATGLSGTTCFPKTRNTTSVSKAGGWITCPTTPTRSRGSERPPTSIDTTHLNPAQVADAVLRHHNLNDTATAAR